MTTCVIERDKQNRPVAALVELRPGVTIRIVTRRDWKRGKAKAA